MNSKDKNVQDKNTSTPKRRRLGTGRIVRPSFKLTDKENNASFLNFSPIHKKVTSTIVSSADRCESPPLPSNQDEFLHDSRNNSSICYIPSSPAIIESSQNNQWEPLSTNDLEVICSSGITTQKIKKEIEDISDDMFQSGMEPKSNQENKQQVNDDHHDGCPSVVHRSQNHVDSNSPSRLESSFVSGQAILDLKLNLEPDHDQGDAVFTMGCEKHFRENVEESFQLINQSICGIEEEMKKCDTSYLFETKDSFLLDIKESCAVVNDVPEFVKPRTPVKAICDNNSFYGLSTITKSLFKTYRNIEKFYDWQEECLSLTAIKERSNLIYAMPTSGGKTLVAEVLMLREVLNRKKNALFILPYVAIVQEKIWSLAPFALNLDFLVEEYAGGKGLLPPKKRRNKKSIYIATIEKGLALVRSLIELDRLDELGLIVVDELHLIGEQGRGATLETLLTTILVADKGIQIVGMSATIGNLPQLARFLRAVVFERQFRPVELVEYVKLGDVLHKLLWTPAGMELVPDRQLAYDYSSAGAALDPDRLGGLVAEVVPRGACLVFCPTKRNCENVAALLCKLQRREMSTHRAAERAALEQALRAEGAGAELARLVRAGVGYHHAGLAADERVLLEQAFRSGVISVLCCTSTLAAGVNLPARRVLVRAPRVGREFITLAAYRQMAGRAGRAGVCDVGESIIMCDPRDWERLRAVLAGGLGAATSQLRPAAPALLLSAAALRMAASGTQLRRVLQCTLLATDPEVDLNEVCRESIKSLIQSGALEVAGGEEKPSSRDDDSDACRQYDDAELVVSKLGNAAIKGCMELATAQQFLGELNAASRGLVLLGGLHLLFLVARGQARPDYRHYYTLYRSLDEEGVQTANVLGITEMNAIRMMTGKPITNVPESVLSRFYQALMLRDLCRQVPFAEVADKYCMSRGAVAAAAAGACAFARCAQRLCEALRRPWYPALLAELAGTLQHCAAPDLRQLMELPAVKKGRAMQLLRAGYKRVEDLARSSADELASRVDHLSRTAATHLISAARMMLIEKVENLRAEAEDVMEDLKLQS